MDLSFLHRHIRDSDSELKMMDQRDDNRSLYVGPNLQTSRTPSAIDHHCQRSYQTAKRKLHSSRAKVRFYVAGEGDHSAVYAVSPQRFSSFDSLLGRLTKTPICIKEKVNKEKYIFSLDGSHKITSLDELHLGESYVCATYEVFEQLTKERERPISSQNRYKSLQTAALAAARPTHTSQSSRSRHSIAVDGDQQLRVEQNEEQQFLAEIKPRLITVLRGGLRPRKSVRILLNRKNTRSFEQIIGGISDILCPGEHIKRLFGISGRLVMCLADFYLEDSVFFAYCNDKMHPEDLVLDNSEVKCVGAYRFRRASAYGRVTLTSHQKGIKNERPRSIPASALPDVYRMSSETRGSSRARSCRPAIVSSPRRILQPTERANSSERKRQSAGQSPTRGRRSAERSPSGGRNSPEKSPTRERQSAEGYFTGGRQAAENSPTREKQSAGRSPTRGGQSAEGYFTGGRQAAENSPTRRSEHGRQSPTRGNKSTEPASPTRGSKSVEPNSSLKRENSPEDLSTREQYGVKESMTKEKQLVEPMEKDDGNMFESKPFSQNVEDKNSSQSSIHTLTPRSRASERSIDMSPSRSVSRHDTPSRKVNGNDKPVSPKRPPPSPSKTETSRHSSPRKPHPSGASLSRKSSKISNGISPSSPHNSPQKQPSTNIADVDDSSDQQNTSTSAANGNESATQLLTGGENKEENIAPQISPRSKEDNNDQYHAEKTPSAAKQHEETAEEEQSRHSRKSSESSEGKIKDGREVSRSNSRSSSTSDRKSKTSSNSGFRKFNDDQKSCKSEEEKSTHSMTSVSSKSSSEHLQAEPSQKRSDLTPEQSDLTPEMGPEKIDLPDESTKTKLEKLDEASESKSGVDEDQYLADFDEEQTTDHDADDEDDLSKQNGGKIDGQ